MNKRKWRALNIIGDVTLYIIVSLFAVLLAYNLIGVKPVNRGYFCDDQTLMYPYKEDSISDGLAAVITSILPLIFILIIEAVHIQCSGEILSSKGSKLTRYIETCYRTVGIFLFGQCMNLLISEVLKVCTGRLRPHFFAVCNPDFVALGCTNSNTYQNVGDEYCQNADASRLIDARKAFPSGHAAISMYGMLYFVIYLQVRFMWRRFRLVLPVLQSVALSVGFYISVSRISDYKHHWGDVLGGGVLGVISCLLTVKYVSFLLKDKQLRKKSLVQAVTKTCSLESEKSQIVGDGQSGRQVVVEMKEPT